MVSALLNIYSLQALENSPHLRNIWENCVFTEFLKEGFSPEKNLFFFRDQNGVEIDFILEKDGKVYLIEAKNSERPKAQKLNFLKVAPLFKENVHSIVACGVEEEGLIALKDFSVYNPLYGFSLFV